MKPLIISLSLALIGVSACEHNATAPEAPVTFADDALQQYAIAQIYEAHPTRALVDKVEAVPSDSAHTVLRIEMTGSPTARKIYQVTISQPSEGTYQLESLETLQ